MKERPNVLIVDDDTRFAAAMGRALRHAYDINTADSYQTGLDALNESPDIVILDLRLDRSRPSELEGLDLLKTIHENYPFLPVFMLTAVGDNETASRCFREGAWDFITKNGSVEEISARIEAAFQKANYFRRAAELERQIQLVAPRSLIGSSPAMNRVRQQILTAAEHGSVTVLIRGETGTGKEVVARAIHASGARADMPFVAVDTVSLPPSTMSSELFGHEPGAFTDARKLHVGYFERAHRGVLFLDEIGDVPPELQARLLRFMEEKTFVRMGGTREIRADVQLVAATNADLESLVSHKAFRNDLYYRLKVFEITIPPLRERAGDIPELCRHFTGMIGYGRNSPREFTPAALEVMSRYAWPGNVRQLKNAVEAAMLNASQENARTVDTVHLPAEISAGQAQTARQDIVIPSCGDGSVNLDRELARVELQMISAALNRVEGRKTDAWRLLGLNDRFALRRRVQGLFAKHPELDSEFPDLAADYARGRR